MSVFSVRVVSWVALAGAILLWGGAGFFSWVVSKEEAARTTWSLTQQEEMLKQASTVKLRSIARSTSNDRAALESLTNTSVDEMLDEIELISQRAGVDVEIQQAFSESTEASPLRTINLTVSANGSFQSVVRAAALLEVFPPPSIIDQIQFERHETSEAKMPAWRVDVRMRVFTSRDPSL